MPEMDGNELVARIVESNREDNLIVVGLTASLDDATRKKMLLEGWTEVLTKPIQPEELSEILQRLTVTNSDVIDMDKTNFEGLRKLSNNNMVIYRDLLETFVRSTNNGREALQSLLEDKQWHSIGEKAHQLAAPFKHFDAMQCYGTLKEIEKLGKNNESTDKIPELVASFLDDSSSVLEQIQTEINTL
jgi:HPt (histidine-containing phosphotransfer) domain-containing protein